MKRMKKRHMKSKLLSIASQYPSNIILLESSKHYQYLVRLPFALHFSMPYLLHVAEDVLRILLVHDKQQDAKVS
jgi:hypothetical protein